MPDQYPTQPGQPGPGNPPPGGPPSAGSPPGYGQQPGYYPQQQYGGVVQPTNGAAVAGGVLGIIAVVFCWIPFVDFIAIILGVLGLIFGVVGNRNAARLGGIGKGMAITGIVTGLIAIVISLLFLIVVYGALIGLHAAVSTTP